MHLRWFRYFVAVVEAGSFSQASRHLGVAQPALSRCIQDIEAHLGTALLLRQPRGLQLTESGQHFFDAALDILKRVDATYERLRLKDSQLSGRIVIGLPTSTSEVLAAPLVQAARTQFPNVQLHIIESLSGFLLEWVQTGRVDLAVLFDPRTHPGLEAQPLMREELWLFGAPAQMAAIPPEGLDMRALAQLPLVMPALPHGLRQQLSAAALAQNLTLNVVAEIDSLQAVARVAEEGTAFAILACPAVATRVAAGRLAGRPIHSPALTRKVTLARSLVRPPNRLSEEMIKLCLQLTQELHASGQWQGELITPFPA